MGLVDNISITRAKTFKGTGYVVYGNLASFPGELESVIHPTTYALAAGLSELCPTSEDGVTLSRTAETSEGIPIDQKAYNLDEGEPTAWAMQAGMTLLDTTLDTVKVIWETPATVDISGSVVEQERLPLGAPTTFTSRQLYIIQEDYYTGRMRVFAFRDAIPQVDGSEMNVQSEEATGLPATFKIRADETLADHHGPFGFIFQEDA